MIIPTKVLCTTGKPPKLLNSNANDLNITLPSRGGHYNDRQPRYSHVAPLRLMARHRTMGVSLPYSEDVTTIAVTSYIFRIYLFKCVSTVAFISKSIVKLQRVPHYVLSSEF